MIGIIAEYTPAYEPHVATDRAIQHSAEALGIDARYEWVSTADIREDFFGTHRALWVAPGSPYKSMQKTLRAIRFAREHGIPTLGTCGGFQHVLIEYARNVLGMTDAEHAEYDPYASRLIVSRLACSLVGREMDLQLAPGSLAREIYGADRAREKYYCNFAVNPEYLEDVRKGPISITGADSEGEPRIVEYPQHPFFIATLFVPQALSQPGAPHPLISAFLRAADKTTR